MPQVFEMTSGKKLAAIAVLLSTIIRRRGLKRKRLGFTVQRVPALASLANSLAHGVICRNEYRLCTESFLRLEEILSPLLDYNYLSRREIIAIGMHFLAHSATINVQCMKFGLSNGTVVKARRLFLKAVIMTFKNYLTPQFWATRGVLEAANSYQPFPGCFGALDGTHISIRAPAAMSAAYRNRKGAISVNALVVCDFSMNFLYCYTGFEGSAHDARVFRASAMPRHLASLPRGLYLMADAAYPNSERILTPYRGQRYHLSEYSRRAPTTPKEYFNLKHSSSRNVIERAIGVCKRRFAVLRKGVETFDTNFHNQLVLACCLLHNFINGEIGRGYGLEELTDALDDDDNNYEIGGNEDEPTASGSDTTSFGNAGQWRDAIADRLWQERH